MDAKYIPYDIYLGMVIFYNTFNIFKQEMSYKYIHMYTHLLKLRKRVVNSTSLQLFREIIIKICILKGMLKVRTLAKVFLTLRSR